MLLEVGNLLPLVIVVYLVLHLPAIIMLVIGLRLKERKPKTSKTLLIAAGIYFLVGAGICGGMF